MLFSLPSLEAPAQSAEPKTPSSKPPNIVFILADDLGFGDVACYNPASKIPTPHLDKLAATGMQFLDAHSPATVCSPTRLSLLTGRHSFRWKGGGRVFVGIGGPCQIEDGRLTLPQMLRNRGYATAAVGKWHVGLTFLDKQGNPITRKSHPDVKGMKRIGLVDFSRPIPDGPVNRGFDSFFGTACCPTTDTLYSYIVDDKIPNPPTKRSDKRKLPRHFYSLDCRGGMQSDDFDHEEVDMVFLKKSQEFLRNHVGTTPDKPFFLYHAMQAVHLPSFPAKQFQGKTKSGPHGDFIFEADFVVGELMKTLKKLGVADDTLVLFSSDNGPETPTVWHMRKEYQHDGSRPWRGVKREVWEGGHRVPLIAHWPGHIEAGARSDQTISLVDMMATLGAITGCALPDSAAEDSFDFKNVLLGKDDGKPVREFTMQASWQGLSIRHGKWKYLEKPYKKRRKGKWVQSFLLPDTAPGHKGQLYDLEADPGETTNLYFKNPEMAKMLGEKLIQNKEAGRSAPERSLNR
ncbi:MAG: arylsulfatase [Planctomycetes bacterium]|nr:arylsulfatase [Planctomycetota bacterium]